MDISTKRALQWALFTFALIYVVKIFFITQYAVDVPWADQWDGEIEAIYFKNTLTFGDLWAQANEHHILLTRLLNNASFLLSKSNFNQINALFAQSAIWALIASGLVFIFKRNDAQHLIIAVLLLIFIPVLDWENFYWSYQSQVYFSMFFAILGSYLCSKKNINLIGIFIFTCAAGFSNAAAVYIPIIALINLLLTGKPSFKNWLSIIFYILLVYLSYKFFVASTPWHDRYKADSLGLLLNSAMKYSAWPNNAGWLIWPALAFCSIKVAHRLNVDQNNVSQLERFGLSLSIWFFLFLVSSIYNRAGFPSIPVRYFSYYLLGISALLCFRWNATPSTRFAALIFASLIYVATVRDTFVQWQDYSAMKMAYRNNFIETIIMAKENPSLTDETLLNNMHKVPLPYAGYPNYEVPLRVIRNPKSWKIFDYLINDNSR